MKCGPRDFKLLCAEIRARYSRMSPRLQQIASFALEHPNAFALQTITMNASLIGVAPSAIIRFAKALDYRGYSDMQAVFRLPLGENEFDGRESPLRYSVVSINKGETQAQVDVFGELLDSSIKSLKLLLCNLPRERQQKVIDSLRADLESPPWREGEMKQGSHRDTNGDSLVAPRRSIVSD